MTVGSKIRELRNLKGLRLMDVARSAGLSASSISQIERGGINPSLPTLTRIADALGVPPGTFFEEQVEPESPARINAGRTRVVSAQKRKILQPSKGVSYQLLTPDLTGEIEFVLAEFEPGSSSADEAYSHVGEECALVLEGELIVEVSGVEYVLHEGESITFQAECLHRIVNRTESTTRAIWVNTPPWF